ncbi:protein APEM9 isoform X2 [Brassica rapa]|uniref:protein APEM9 isoform X2 n=1 Tax=Brassica campestris TaxID=3711 RepID=UPI000872E07A|nr:protein APEM9 isoform X2 [Brassica rapa]
MEATDGIWGEIERSESYLVCSMYEEAESLSSSILKGIFGNVETLGDHQLLDMLESTGMVLVQSLNGLGRGGEIVNELRQVFGETAAVPVQVLLTGEKVFHGNTSLDIDEYMEVVELYTFGVLGKDTNDVCLAVSWVEQAALSEERRQGLLRRLDSLLSLKSPNVQEATSLEENPSYDVVNSSNKSLANEKNDYILKLSKQHEPWSSRPLSLKFGNTRFSMSRGKVAISLVGLIICYALQRKRAALIRIIRRQMESTKKAIVDFWKLAFSYQVNPLAAIQPIPSTTT